MLEPADIWALWGGAVTAYLVGVIAWMQPSVRLCERGSAWWLLAPVFWPMATAIACMRWISLRRGVAAYHRAHEMQQPVRLVQEGRPYGSPISGALADELGLVDVRRLPVSSGSRCPQAAGPAP
jgi:hypothetical protein